MVIQKRIVAALAVLAAIAYRKRRSVPGLVVYVLCVALPRTVVLKLLAMIFPSQSNAALSRLDLLSAAFVAATRWLLTGNIDDIVPTTRAFSKLDAFKARSLGATVVRHSENSVNGIWVAEKQSDIPSTSASGLTVAHKDAVVLLYIHGGGYFFNSAEFAAHHHFLLCKEFNAQKENTLRNIRLIVFSLEYDLAPHSPYPSQVFAAADTFKWLQDIGYQHILVGGDSAGAHCTIALMNHIAKTPSLAGLSIQPSGAILFSPWVNPFINDCSSSKGTPIYDILSLKSLKYGRDIVFSIMVSPSLENEVNFCKMTRDDLHLPQSLVIYGGAEVLCEEIEEFVFILKSQGKNYKDGIVEVHKFDGMPHDFNLILGEPMFSAVYPHATNAIRITADFIRRSTNK
ncbi:UNVERIFIED_CONTAM: hypothetical protein HDU68_008325 [Siphonaria sp. JEL0065]|nr:hypothetical protein HDU68_008325 [Siphonaria sp. JEL0065]